MFWLRSVRWSRRTKSSQVLATCWSPFVGIIHCHDKVRGGYQLQVRDLRRSKRTFDVRRICRQAGPHPTRIGINDLWLTLNYPILRIRHLEQFLASVLGYRRTSRQPSHAALIALAFAGPDIVVAVTRTGVCHVLDLCKFQIRAKAELGEAIETATFSENGGWQYWAELSMASLEFLWLSRKCRF